MAEKWITLSVYKDGQLMEKTVRRNAIKEITEIDDGHDTAYYITIGKERYALANPETDIDRIME